MKHLTREKYFVYVVFNELQLKILAYLYSLGFQAITIYLKLKSGSQIAPVLLYKHIKNVSIAF